MKKKNSKDSLSCQITIILGLVNGVKIGGFSHNSHQKDMHFFVLTQCDTKIITFIFLLPWPVFSDVINWLAVPFCLHVFWDNHDSFHFF